jgi:hypothetical protein
MKPLSIFLLLVSLLFCTSAFALRCGRVLVNIGDYKHDVVEKCGEPESMESHIERRGEENYANGSQFNGWQQHPRSGINYGQNRYIEVEVVIDEWIYDFGRRRLQQYLRFENGRLKEVKSAGRGD